MAKEPNTNPDSGEGQKPSREGPSGTEGTASKATRKAATRSTRTTRSTPAKATSAQSSGGSKARRSGPETPLEESLSEFSTSLQQLQGEAAKEHRNLLEKINADVDKLRNDVASSDPTKSFVRDVTEAVSNRDPTALAEAYATLFRHSVQRQALAEKRLLDIVTGYYRGLNDIAEHAQKGFMTGAQGYSDAVAEVLAGTKLSELKPTDQTLAAHALLMGAIVQSMAQR